ncbi:MAG: hypothetical protein ACREDM_07270 [Methylocella sp.]
MRILLVISLLIAAIGIDTFAFDARYRRAAWQEAKHQGDLFNDELQRWLPKIGQSQ